jgi:hypothetical protein
MTAAHGRQSTSGSTEAVTKSLEFLAARQRPSGRFPIQVGLRRAAGDTEDDPSLFATSLVAHALGYCDEPAAHTMLHRATRHLRDQMEAPGVWRHWTADHPQFHALPADLDDTAGVSAVLRREGVEFPDNTDLCLANRDGSGLFYTWLVPRWPPPRPGLGLWRLFLRRALRPLHARMFWRTSAAPDDVDAIVNANVLHYLGDGPHAPPVVHHLLGILRRGEEDRSDNWYRSPFVFYYAVARCAAIGVSGLAEAGTETCERIVAAANEDGRIGSGPADTALAVSALAQWGAGEDERARAVAYLEATQAPDGSWPAEPIYFGGPRHHPEVPSWGSDELTTALCLEALVRSAGSGRS